MYKLKIFVLIAITFGLIGCANGPLEPFGYHPHYESQSFNLEGKKALIITTSHDQLGEDGDPTGVFGSEMTAPYYEFLKQGMEVDLASIKGGEIPIDPISFKWGVKSSYDSRYQEDSVFQNKAKHSIKIDNIDFTQYDTIFLAGGWGAAYDLGYSEVLGQKISEAYAAGIPVGGVCHGPLGLLKAKNEKGESLIKGRRLTAVTDKQIHELSVDVTPLHPETELRKAGVIYESESAFFDIFANHVVVDGIIVTGQNQNAGAEVASKMMAIIAEQ